MKKRNHPTKREQVLILYKQGLSRQEIAEKLQISSKAVNSHIAKLREAGNLPAFVQIPTEDLVKEFYEQELTIDEISSKLSISRSTVSKHLRHLSLSGKIEKREPIFKADKIEELYNKGASFDEMAEQLNIPIKAVYSHIHRLKTSAKIQERKVTYKKDIIKELYLQGKSYREISVQANCSVHAVGASVSKMQKAGELELRRPRKAKPTKETTLPPNTIGTPKSIRDVKPIQPAEPVKTISQPQISQADIDELDIFLRKQHMLYHTKKFKKPNIKKIRYSTAQLGYRKKDINLLLHIYLENNMISDAINFLIEYYVFGNITPCEKEKIDILLNTLEQKKRTKTKLQQKRYNLEEER